MSRPSSFLSLSCTSGSSSGLTGSVDCDAKVGFYLVRCRSEFLPLCYASTTTRNTLSECTAAGFSSRGASCSCLMHHDSNSSVGILELVILSTTDITAQAVSAVTKVFTSPSLRLTDCLHSRLSRPLPCLLVTPHATLAVRWTARITVTPAFPRLYLLPPRRRLRRNSGPSVLFEAILRQDPGQDQGDAPGPSLGEPRRGNPTLPGCQLL